MCAGGCRGSTRCYGTLLLISLGMWLPRELALLFCVEGRSGFPRNPRIVPDCLEEAWPSHDSLAPGPPGLAPLAHVQLSPP
jgi:hypothetical protein